MVTKANRSKASARIEKAKAKYKVAEDRTDSLILRIAASDYTLTILLVACGLLLLLLL